MTEELPPEGLTHVAPTGEDELGLPAVRRRKPAAREGRGRGRRETGRAGFRLAIPIIIGGAIATLIISILYTKLGSVDYTDFAFFLVVFTVFAHLDMELKGGGKINLGLAPLLAALIALPAVEVAWIFLFGTLVTVVTRMLDELDKDAVLSLLLDYAGVGVTAVIYRFVVNILPKKPVLLGRYWPGILIAIAIAAAVLFFIQLLRSTYVQTQEGHLPGAVYFQSILRKSWLPFLALGFIGVLMGLIFMGTNMWSILFALPLLFVFRYAYNRVAATDRYLLETIRTLAAIPEEAGMLPKGHAERVAQLSVAVARELGLSPEDTQQVQYAAYLHDIGAIMKSVEADAEQKQLMEVEGVITGGVYIIDKVDYLEVAAEILRGREGLRDRVVDVDKRRAVSMGAGILKTVDDFEALVQGSEGRESLSETDALTEMNLERGVQYDSKVLRSIARVLPRLPTEGYSSSAEGSAEGSPLRGEQES